MDQFPTFSLLVSVQFIYFDFRIHKPLKHLILVVYLCRLHSELQALNTKSIIVLFQWDMAAFNKIRWIQNVNKKNMKQKSEWVENVYTVGEIKMFLNLFKSV